MVGEETGPNTAILSLPSLWHFLSHF